MDIYGEPSSNRILVPKGVRLSVRKEFGVRILNLRVLFATLLPQSPGAMKHSESSNMFSCTFFYARSFGLQHLAKTSTEELGLFIIPESASALQVPKVTTAPQPVPKVAKVPKVANLNKARSGCGAGLWYAKGIWLEWLATHSLHHANTVYPLLL